MNLRTTLILVVLAVLSTVGVETMLVGRHPWFIAERGQPFAAIQKEFFQSIRIERGGETIALTGAADEWAIVEPLEFPARLATVERMIRLIRNLRVRGEKGEGQIDDSGLAVSFTDGQGNVTRLVFGDEVDLGSQRFVQFEVEGEVAWCDLHIRDGFRDLKLEEVRDDALTHVFARHATRLEVEDRVGDRRVVVAANGDEWQVLEPYETLAAPEEVIHTLSVLNAWAILDYVTDTFDPSAGDPYGLREPRYRVRVVGPDATDVLLVGGEAGPSEVESEEPDVYVAWEGKPFVFRVSGEPLFLFARGTDAYRSRQLVDLPPELKSVEIEAVESVRIEITGRDRDRMTVVGSDASYPVDHQFLVELTEFLRMSRVEKFIPRSESLQAQEFGLVTPTVLVRLDPKEGDPEEIRIGAEVKDAAGPSALRYVWNRRWDQHYATMDLPILELLTNIPYSLRSAQVFDLPSPVVQRFEVEIPGHGVRSFVRPSSTWFDDATKKMVDEEVLNRALACAYTLVAAEWRAAEADDPGPNQYELRVQVSTPGFEKQEFWIGPEIPDQPGERWCRKGEEEWVFRTVPPEGRPELLRYLIDFAAGRQ